MIREISKDIFTVGSIDWDRRLFDELISLPDGTTYNSYLIKGTPYIERLGLLFLKRSVLKAV